MKTYKTIIREMTNNINKINVIREQINAEKDAEKVAELCAKMAKLNLIQQILRDNYTYALSVAALEAARDVYRDFDGKAFGEMTEKKTSKEMRRRGFSFWFHRYSWGGKEADTINIYAVNDNGYECRDEATIYSTRETDANGNTTRNDFITSENKINYHAIETAKPSGKYCDNPAKRAGEIIKARQKFAAIAEKAYAAQCALNDLLPANIDHFRNVNQYIKGF